MRSIYREIKTNFQFERKSIVDWPGHIHDDIELVYVKQGCAAAFCDGKHYILQEGSFFLAFPNQSHHYLKSTPGLYLVLVMKPSRLRYHDGIFLDGYPTSALYGGKDETLGPLLETALEEFLTEGDSSIVDGYLTAFFGKLLRGYRIEKSRLSRDCVLSILEYCTQHYREDIRIEDLSRQLHISRSHISHIFSHRLNMNFCDYVNSLRLSDAVKLLENRDYSISNVSDLSGFSTIRTFNRAFLKRYGISPSQYRAALDNET